MVPNNSPWIKQLKRARPVVPLDKDIETDVAVIGGGIAGISSAYFILRDTDKKVVLIEGDKVAHGATGHNAGILVAAFERPFQELINEFGFEMAINGQKDIESAWTILDEIYNEAGLQTPLYRFTGYTGYTEPTNLENLLKIMEENSSRIKGNLNPYQILIAKENKILSQIPKKYEDSYSLIPKADLLKLLETENDQFVVAVADNVGCMNSALFSEELAGYMLSKYGDRFTLAEESPVKKIDLDVDHANLEILNHKINTKQIILCTNGFENVTITNKTGSDINTEFHHLVTGWIGYMAGYFEKQNNPPTAIKYLTKVQESVNPNDPASEPYLYLSRRPHEHASHESHNFVSMGGPERILPNLAIYSKQDMCPDDVFDDLKYFFRATYSPAKENDHSNTFCWHGLMGYTPNGIRRIGPEPCNPVLMYNLGCNGIGILPSIYGGKRISQFLKNNGKLEPSIFDPVDQR